MASERKSARWLVRLVAEERRLLPLPTSMWIPSRVAKQLERRGFIERKPIAGRRFFYGSTVAGKSSLDAVDKQKAPDKVTATCTDEIDRCPDCSECRLCGPCQCEGS